MNRPTVTGTLQGSAVSTADGVTLEGTFPRLVFLIDAPGGGRREFFRAVSRSACAFDRTEADGAPVPVEAVGRREAYLVYGLPACLKALCLCPAVLSWHFAMSGKPPVRSAGAGEEKYRPRGTGGEVDGELLPWPNRPDRPRS